MYLRRIGGGTKYRDDPNPEGSYYFNHCSYNLLHLSLDLKVVRRGSFFSLLFISIYCVCRSHIVHWQETSLLPHATVATST